MELRKTFTVRKVFGKKGCFLVNSIDKRRNAVEAAVEHTNQKLEEAKSSGHSKETEKIVKNLASHLEVLQRMQTCLEKIETPAPPQSAKVKDLLYIMKRIQIECNTKNSVVVNVTPNYNMCDVVIKYKSEPIISSDIVF